MTPAIKFLAALLVSMPPGTFRTLNMVLNGGSTGVVNCRAEKSEDAPIPPQTPLSRSRSWTETTFTISQVKTQIVAAVMLPIETALVTCQPALIQATPIPLADPEPRQALLTRSALLL